MLIDPALDVWVWSAAGLLLALLGARAWAVETGQARLGRTTARARVLTIASGLALLGFVGLLTVQGGALLTEAIVTGNDPFAARAAAEQAAADAAQAAAAKAADPAGPGAVDPAAPGDPAGPPVDPAAPAVPPFDPAAP